MVRFVGLAFMVVFPAVATAQAEFGIKAGMNVSDVVMTNYIDPDVESALSLKLGLHAGVYVSGPVSERVGVSGELLYSDKGVKGAFRNIHLHYITIPLLAQYRFTGHVVGEFGPEPGYLFAARSNHGSVTNTYNNKFDISLDAGLRFGTGSWLIALRYCAGLFSVRELEPSTVPAKDRVKYQNRVLQLSIGYKLWEVE